MDVEQSSISFQIQATFVAVDTLLSRQESAAAVAGTLQHQHPARTSPCLPSAGALFLLYKLLTFPRWRDELAHAPRFAGAVAFLLGVVVVENFCTWATSASDRRKYSYVPLQDNAEIALLWLFKVKPRVRKGGRVPAPGRLAGGTLPAQRLVGPALPLPEL